MDGVAKEGLTSKGVLDNFWLELAQHFPEFGLVKCLYIDRWEVVPFLGEVREVKNDKFDRFRLCGRIQL